ncbi:MAG: hypothetical protein ACI9W2_003547 [Gammaproteobacteria bacterium]|jgi:hypothetical protein
MRTTGTAETLAAKRHQVLVTTPRALGSNAGMLQAPTTQVRFELLANEPRQGTTPLAFPSKNASACCSTMPYGTVSLRRRRRAPDARIKYRVHGEMTMNQLSRFPHFVPEIAKYLLFGTGTLTFGVTSALVIANSREGFAGPRSATVL